MKQDRIVMLALISAGLMMFDSARAQETLPPWPVLIAQGSDDYNERAKRAVELGLLKEVEKPMSKSPKRLDPVMPAVKQAQELMQAKKFPEALARLAELDALASKTAEERYLIERIRVAIASLANDDTLLVKSIEAVLASGQAPPKERVEFSYLLARKYFNQKNYPRAISWSTHYFDAGGNDGSIRRALVLSYYLNNDFSRAQEEIGADIQAEEIAGNKPTEEQLRLMVSCAQKLDDKAALASAMAKFAMYYPGKK